jgi:pyrroline-5-carboxylate reductase
VSLIDIGPVVLIGAGKMGLALVRSWLQAGLVPNQLVLVDPKPQDATISFAEERGIRLLATPTGVLTQVLVLAVKPQVIGEVMAEVRASVGRQTLVVSIAAGIGIGRLSEGLGTGRIVRTMPNTPAQVGKGITGAVAGPEVTAADRDVATRLIEAAGAVVWFAEESKLDAVTAVSGSGPAYVFHLVEALATAAEAQGLDPDQAMLLARQTVIGAAALLEADPAPAATLRQNVTSPKGTTEAALEVLMGAGALTGLIKQAVEAARRRSEELGRD